MNPIFVRLLLPAALLVTFAASSASALEPTPAALPPDPPAAATLPEAPIPALTLDLPTDTAAPTTPPKPPSNPTACQADYMRRQAMTPEQLKAEESQYIGGVVPNFNTVLGGCSPHLTAPQKLSLVYHNAIDPFTFALSFVVGGLDEVDGSHNGYGWGPGGYFKRVGASYADYVDSAIVGNGLLPILFKQDPRYFQLGEGHHISKRIWQGVVAVVVCHGDNGKLQFNYSNVAGNFIAGAISNAYYPAADRGLSLTLDGALITTIEGAIGNQFLEFSPELSRFADRLLHGGHRSTPPASKP